MKEWGRLVIGSREEAHRAGRHVLTLTQPDSAGNCDCSHFSACCLGSRHCQANRRLDRKFRMTEGRQVLLELFLDSQGHLECVRHWPSPSSPRGCLWLQKSGSVPRLQPLTRVPSVSIV